MKQDRFLQAWFLVNGNFDPLSTSESPIWEDSFLALGQVNLRTGAVTIETGSAIWVPNMAPPP
jgi:hypothetical protein